MDIDEKLIKQANYNLNFQYSLMKPQDEEAVETEIETEKKKLQLNGNLDKTKDLEIENDKTKWNYFPISFGLTFGFVPFEKTTNKNFFPYNVQLQTKDFVNEDLDKKNFDVILWFLFFFFIISFYCF